MYMGLSREPKSRPAMPAVAHGANAPTLPNLPRSHYHYLLTAALSHRNLVQSLGQLRGGTSSRTAPPKDSSKAVAAAVAKVEEGGTEAEASGCLSSAGTAYLVVSSSSKAKKGLLGESLVLYTSCIGG